VGDLDGKVAIVTGAARGIGRSEAMVLAARGATVVVNDLGGAWDGTGRDDRPAQQVADEIVAAGGSASANYDDVSDWEGGQRLVNQAIEQHGRLDIVVCNAGILRDRMTVNMTLDEWHSVLKVHLDGHFVPIRFAAAYWREAAKAGEMIDARLVLTSSESGTFGNPGQLNYAAAKAGIASMGLVLSRELGRYGVTVNTVCPRARTRLNESTFGEFKIDESGPDVWHPDNVGALVGYLCSPAAKGVTGQTFAVGAGNIDLLGGWHVIGHVERFDEMWNPDSIGSAIGELFGENPTALPAFDFEVPVEKQR
jgi:NAD(P)-dependent dehydrogenase (short-subunit alcohol dehydrogenase family)